MWIILSFCKAFQTSAYEEPVPRAKNYAVTFDNVEEISITGKQQ